jgi:chromosome segregation ATPase
MDTNTTLAHLAAQIAELRDQMTYAELEAIHWKKKFEEMEHSHQHLEEANREYAEAVEWMQGRIDQLSGQLAQKDDANE